MWRRLPQRLFGLLHRRRTDEDFRAELDAHLAIETDRLIAEGMTPDEARFAARRAFGNVTTARERFHESRQILWLEELRQDVRYAWRALLRSPGFAAVAVLTMALGVGANSAIFSVINAVVLRPLPYRAPGELMLIEPGETGLSPGWAVAAWQTEARTLSGLAGFNGPRAATLIADRTPEQVDAADVSWNLLSMLGVAPAHGRDFTEADGITGAPPVAIISDDLWRTRFGAETSVVGRTVTVSGRTMTIVGVTGPAFRFPTAGVLPAFGLPFDMQPDVMSPVTGQRYLNAIARLDGRATPAMASAELLAIYRRAGAAEFSQSFLDRTRIGVASLEKGLVGDLPRRLWLVMGAVTFVLLVACTNVANLLLARASVRQREIALRTALGAGQGRLARLVLTESLVLAAIGAAGALLFAYFTTDLARTLLADRIPHVGAVAIDWRVMAFTGGLAVLTGVVCGLLSLPMTRRVNLTAVFNDGGTQSVTSRSLLRRLLLSAETAVTFVLVVGAALLVQTLWNLRTQDNGFDASQLLTVRVTPGLPADLDRSDFEAGSKYYSGFFADLRGRLEQLPGVSGASAISLGPLEGTSAGVTGVRVNGRPALEDDELLTPVAFVTPGHFQTMRMRLLAGRDFTDADRVGSEMVAIVNQSFQHRFEPDGSVIGARVTTGSGSEAFTIVGVVEDVPDRSLRQDAAPFLIAPLAQMPAMHISWGSLTFVLRSAGRDPQRIAPDVQRAIWAIDPNIVISGLATMDARLAAGMRAERDSALLFGAFALAALVMAAIGVYGVAAYSIAQRTKEIGIRVALGAARRDVSRMVASHALRPVAAGIAAGIAAAAAAVQLISSMVYGVAPLDVGTFAAAVFVLSATALAATWLPARRALRIDPLSALRD